MTSTIAACPLTAVGSEGEAAHASSWYSPERDPSHGRASDCSRALASNVFLRAHCLVALMGLAQEAFPRGWRQLDHSVRWSSLRFANEWPVSCASWLTRQTENRRLVTLWLIDKVKAKITNDIFTFMQMGTTCTLKRERRAVKKKQLSRIWSYRLKKEMGRTSSPVSKLKAVLIGMRWAVIGTWLWTVSRSVLRNTYRW